MKALKISLIAFTLLLGIIAVNYIYISKVCDDLEKYIDDITALCDSAHDCSEEIDSISDYWQKNRRICTFSVSKISSDKVDDLMVSLRAYHKSENIPELERAAKLLRNAVENMRHLEQFWIDHTN